MGGVWKREHQRRGYYSLGERLWWFGPEGQWGGDEKELDYQLNPIGLADTQDIKCDKNKE